MGRAQNVQLPSCYSSSSTNIALASADRRPVDPPPIVDLRIFEGLGEDKKDVTFSHQANFFLYTTLEHARPMNQGRVTASAATLPVLTGTPVAGMAYLDRPKQAGYFIFPDLSVRHEGKYRLSFNLYEELKEPEKDADPRTPEGSPAAMGTNAAKSPSSSRNFVHFRLEVKSGPFSVFSAKKFPGLAESTHLSRLVNEQGCRVRIRRDVRMRRRDKVPESYQDVGDDCSYPQPDRYQTPQQESDRPRSLSLDVATPYGIERRPSLHEVGYYQPTSYQQQPPPPPPQSASSYTSHLSFGGSNTQPYQTPTMHAPSHPAPLSQYPQPASTYPYPPQSRHRQISTPQNYVYPCQPPQQATYMPPAFVDERSTYPDSRRSSKGISVSRQQPTVESYVQNHPALQTQTASQQIRPFTPPNSDTTNQGPPSLPSISTIVHQPPLEMPTSEPKPSGSGMPQGPQNPYSASSYTSSGYSGYTSGPSASNPSSAIQTKRSYGVTFDDRRQLSQPMHDGNRPNSFYQAQDHEPIQTQDGDLMDGYGDVDESPNQAIRYRRADGTVSAKKCPSPRNG